MNDLSQLADRLPRGEKRDTILVLGSPHGGDYITEKMADLHSQFPRHFIISGFNGEAESLRDSAVRRGISSAIISLETKASNTMENIVFSRELILSLTTNDLGIIVKDYAAIRAYLTAIRHLPTLSPGVIHYTLPNSSEDKFRSEFAKLYRYYDLGYIADPTLIGIARGDSLSDI
ncbi:YdcF family protein (plasmid) [Rhizobium leguminosarum]